MSYSSSRQSLPVIYARQLSLCISIVNLLPSLKGDTDSGGRAFKIELPLLVPSLGTPLELFDKMSSVCF